MQIRTKIAIITGYGPQRYNLQTMVKQLSLKNLDIDVDTVDAFQGSQKDIIIYSTVKYSLQGTTQGRYLTGGVPPARFSM